MGRFTLRQPSQSITGAVALSWIQNIATHSIYVSEVYLYVENVTGSDQLVRVQLVLYATDATGAAAGGTSTGLMVSNDDGTIDTFGGSYQVYDGTWSTEPAVLSVQKTFAANFSPGFHIMQWKPSGERRFNAGTTVRIGLKSVAPVSAVVLASELSYYQG